jgi:ATP-dependent DNA helicase RecG
MTPERLQELIAAGESLDVEFKSDEHRPLSDDDLVEAVVCLANRSSDTPAWLLVGIEDDGRVTGARPRHESGRTDPVRLTALIANRTRPSLTPRIEVVRSQDKEIIVVEFRPSPFAWRPPRAVTSAERSAATAAPAACRCSSTRCTPARPTAARRIIPPLLFLMLRGMTSTRWS